MPKSRMADLVVIVPGIMGSVLEKSGKEVWSPKVAANAGLLGFGSLVSDVIPRNEDDKSEDLGDQIVPTRICRDYYIVPGIYKLDGYSKLLEMLKAEFEVWMEGESKAPPNLIEFPYDWRRSNLISAKKMQGAIEKRLWDWRKHTGDNSSKAIIIAHSMGGIVSRCYLECFEGWKDCRAFISLATPYRGSLDVLDYLANGYKIARYDVSPLVRACTSVYELLPIYKVVESSGEWHRVAELENLPNLLHSKAKAGLSFHHKIIDAVASNQDNDNYRSNPYLLTPIVGTGQNTLQSAQFSAGHLKTTNDLPGGIQEIFGEGDTRVPRVSAIPIDQSNAGREMHIVETHGCLPSNKSMLEDLRRRLELIQNPIEEIRGVLGSTGTLTRIGIEVSDAYPALEPISIVATIGSAHSSQIGSEYLAEVTCLSESREKLKVRMTEKDGAFTAEIRPLTPGNYRVTVRSEKFSEHAPEPVSDIFTVYSSQ